MKRNSLKRELDIAKALGFANTAQNTLIKNPTMRLANGQCLVYMAGGLISLVKTETFFGTGQYLKLWKSSSNNAPFAAMTSTQVNADGQGRHTEIYYREIYKKEIEDLARRYGCKPEEVVVDHINNIRGDNYDENLRLATPGQNNQNRSKVKITKAFYTIDEVKEKLNSGEWVSIELTEGKKVTATKVKSIATNWWTSDLGFSDDYITYRSNNG